MLWLSISPYPSWDWAKITPAIDDDDDDDDSDKDDDNKNLSFVVISTNNGSTNVATNFDDCINNIFVIIFFRFFFWMPLELLFSSVDAFPLPYTCLAHVKYIYPAEELLKVSSSWCAMWKKKKRRQGNRGFDDMASETLYCYCCCRSISRDFS